MCSEIFASAFYIAPWDTDFLWTVYLVNSIDISSPTDLKAVSHLPNMQQESFCHNRSDLNL